MRSRWSALLYNLAARRVTVEMPVETSNAALMLNAPGSLTLTSPLNAPGLTAEHVEERRNAAILLRDGAVVSGGIIETMSAKAASNELTLGCLGWAHWLRHVHLRQDLTFAGIDQANIVSALIAAATARTGALDFDVSAPATGRTRDRSYWAWERHPIGTLIEQLADVTDGFNFRCDTVAGADGSYRPRLVMSYPPSGRPTPIVLQVGSNVELLTVEGSGETIANDVEMVGAGQGPEAPAAGVSDVGALEASPVWEAVEVHADVSSAATLQEKAQRRFDLGHKPIRLPKIRLGLDADPPFGSYVVGDRVRVINPDGPLRFDGMYLLTQIGVQVSRDSEHVDLTLAPTGFLR